MTLYGQVKAKIQGHAIACGRDPNEIVLIAVSKSCSAESLQAVYQEGGRDFGESRLQEALEKIPVTPSDCKWHLIGSLQKNKVLKAVSSFQLIHSVDHPDLAKKISEESLKRGASTSILLQVNTSGERTKHGLTGKEWEKQLDSINLLSHIKVEGLMTIAPFTEDKQMIRSSFRKLFELREAWRPKLKDRASFNHLSMGMSHDYLIAIEEGATLLRIGSAIFGNR